MAVVAAPTPREREVLTWLARGLSEKAIAQTLGISANTTRNHVTNPRQKLAVDSAIHAVMLALRLGIVPLEA